jgi:hypothetical protein
MNPGEMADVLGRNLRELQKQLWERVQELKVAQEELVNWKKREEEFRTVSEQLEKARLHADTAEKQLQMESQKAARILAELQLARAAQHQAESQLAGAAERARALEEQNRGWEQKIARLEARSPESIPKRGLQVCLDAMQAVTPGPVRNAVRQYYLNWFYFRMFPERRPGGQ